MCSTNGSGLGNILPTYQQVIRYKDVAWASKAISRRNDERFTPATSFAIEDALSCAVGSDKRRISLR